MGLFKNRQAEQNLSARQVQEAKYANARRDILFVLVFTVVNFLLLLTNTNTYFLFSAYIPYVLAVLGMDMCGKFPDEYYMEVYGGVPQEFYSGTVFGVLLAIAAVILLMYLACWYFSNKGRVAWLIFALVLFGLDSLGLLFLGGISADNIFDIVFHGWFVVSLVSGVLAHYKLKKLPPEEEPQDNYMDAFVEAPAEEAEPAAPTEE